MAADGDVLNVLWGLVAAGVSAITGFSFRKSQAAFNLSKLNEKDIAYMQQDLADLKAVPTRLAVVEKQMDTAIKTLERIEAHTARTQRTLLARDMGEPDGV